MSDSRCFYFQTVIYFYVYKAFFVCAHTQIPPEQMYQVHLIKIDTSID